MLKHFLLCACLAFCLVLSSSAFAISDDANPWLAIENAICVSHRTVDYSTKLGARVVINDAQWRGAADGLPTHCFLSGRVGDEVFDIRLPTAGNGKIYDPSIGSEGENEPTSRALLSQGYAVLLSPPSSVSAMLLSAAVDHQYATLTPKN